MYSPIAFPGQSHIIGDGKGGAHRDTAHVLTPCDFEIAPVSPAEAPAVLDGPVICSLVNAVAHRKHSVVDSLGFIMAQGALVHSLPTVNFQAQQTHYVEQKS